MNSKAAFRPHADLLADTHKTKQQIIKRVLKFSRNKQTQEPNLQKSSSTHNTKLKIIKRVLKSSREKHTQEPKLQKRSREKLPGSDRHGKRRKQSSVAPSQASRTEGQNPTVVIDMGHIWRTKMKTIDWREGLKAVREKVGSEIALFAAEAHVSEPIFRLNDWREISKYTNPIC